MSYLNLPKKDTYPYASTWKSLSKQEEREVRRRAKRLQISLPEMLFIIRKEAK